ncbi:MlaD family protein [Actinocorallia longicatena]|uniref:MlaD family protein n=1 Tax=Actinocorallia longicatena TaxID=111803 RepID=A0ABP6QN97_9ACTN
MLTLQTKIKNVIFLLIAIVCLAYIGTGYADLGRYFGRSGYYTVHVDLSEAGGLLTNADVTYRGVSVGRVGPVRLTANGVRADLHVYDSQKQIPSDLKAVVASRSAVGEQFIDLRPNVATAPYLTEGSVVAQDVTTLPAPVTDLLASLNDLAGSVPLDALRTVVDELGTAFAGQGPDLQQLLDNGTKLVDAADAHSTQTKNLIDSSTQVLATQNDEAGSVRRFAAGTKLLARQLRTSDPDLRRLIAAAPQATTQVSELVKELDPSLSVLFANLLTTSDVFLVRVKGLEQLLVRAPAAVAAGSTVVQNGKLSFSMVPTFFDPLPCTKGYGATYRNALDTAPPPGLNIAAHCALPASSGTEVRGPANAPKAPPLMPVAVPGSSAVPTSSAGGAMPGALGLPPLPAGSGDLAALLGLVGT